MIARGWTHLAPGSDANCFLVFITAAAVTVSPVEAQSDDDVADDIRASVSDVLLPFC
jgi:hypothetical protein